MSAKPPRKKRRAPRPFSFVGCFEIKEMLGRRARDVQELFEHLEEVSPDSIYYHTYSYFLRHRYIKGPYPNDFATWAGQDVGDRVLGERLGVLNPFAFDSVEALRNELISIIDDHLQRIQTVPRVDHGEPFEFMSSRIVEIPTNLQVSTLADFVEALRDVEVSAVYFHVFEAQLRMKNGKSDFSVWIEKTLGYSDLAHQLDALDPYLLSLEEIRDQIIELCQEALEGVQSGA